MQELNFKIEGMMCTGCENRVKNALGMIDGIEEVFANHKEGIVTLKVSKSIPKEIIKERITDLGFEVKE